MVVVDGISVRLLAKHFKDDSRERTSLTFHWKRVELCFDDGWFWQTPQIQHNFMVWVCVNVPYIYSKAL